MSEMFSQGEIDRIIEDSWHEWQEEESCDVYDEYGNYKYPGDVELTEPNTATSMPCKDTISRQAAIDAINRLSIHDFAYEVKTGWIVRDDAVDELMALQPVTPSVIEDIKAEIKQKREENRNGEYDKIFELCLLIIDKHTSGKEQA